VDPSESQPTESDRNVFREDSTGGPAKMSVVPLPVKVGPFTVVVLVDTVGHFRGIESIRVDPREDPTIGRKVSSFPGLEEFYMVDENPV
jgi:hypothetical protein